jgi:urea transport system ATP-binding protein
MLTIRNVNQYYSGSHILRDVSFDVPIGQCTALLGRNGVGKTTLLKCIIGLLPIKSGAIEFGAVPIASLPPYARAKLGLAYVPQGREIFPRLTVAENLELAMKADKRVGPTLFARLDSSARDRILRTLELIHLVPDAKRPAGLLSHGQKQWLEIGMLLMQEPRVLLLDEPVAGMTDEETMRSAELFLALAGEYTLVVVEHDMDFVARIADRVTVLHEGRVLAEGSMHQVQRHEQVIEVFLGR